MKMLQKELASLAWYNLNNLSNQELGGVLKNHNCIYIYIYIYIYISKYALCMDIISGLFVCI